jgi:hypothetical protein
MSEENNKQNNNNNSDEIDLKQLFSAIGDFFKNIFIGFILILVGIKNATIKYFKIIFLFFVLGGLVGIGLNFYLPEYYTSSMLLQSKHASGRLMENSVDKLDQLCEEKNYSQLANILKIDSSAAANLKGFSYEPFVSEEEIVELEVLKEQLKSEIDDELVINKFVERLKNENKATYRIFVEVYNNKKLTKLEEPLLSYFKGSDYVGKRIEIETQNLKLTEQNIEEEIAKLDSLKNLLLKNFNLYAERTRTGSNNVIMNDDQLNDPMNVFEESRKLYAQLLRVREQLYLTPSFELIDGFTVFSKPASPGILKLGFYSCLYGLLIAYIIILLIFFNKYLNSVEEKNKIKKETQV